MSYTYFPYYTEAERREAKYINKNKDSNWEEKKVVEGWKKNLKEWKEKGEIPMEEFSEDLKEKFEKVGIEFDEEGNVTNELNNETIEKLYAAYLQNFGIISSFLR